MLPGALLNGDDVEVSNRKRIALGLDLRTVVMNDVVDNYSLMNETKTLLCEEYVEYCVITQKYNQRKVKDK